MSDLKLIRTRCVVCLERLIMTQQTYDLVSGVPVCESCARKLLGDKQIEELIAEGAGQPAYYLDQTAE